jgi:hypothetical protein
MVETSGKWAKFSFYRPEAGHVELVGEFVGSGRRRLPMIRTRTGHWVAALRLPPGVHKFRYCADGDWYCDFASFGVEYGPFGPRARLWIAPNASRRSHETARKG